MLEDDKKAYAELLEILEHVNQEYLNKIPKELIFFFQNNKDENYVKHIDFDKSVEEQNISEKTILLFIMLMLNYWCDLKEREALKNIFDENERKYQERLNEKYNPTNIFPEKNLSKLKQSNYNLIEKDKYLIHKNDIAWYKKIFIKIKSFINNLLKK